MFGETILQFEIHGGRPQKSLILLADFTTRRGGGRGFAAFGDGLLAVPPIRQKEGEWMGHGSLVQSQIS